MTGIQNDILVIGAGPAGMMAAIEAASQDCRVLVLDHMKGPGIKLLATGGGRCNFTNTLPPEPFMARFGRSGRFMAPALDSLDREALLEFFAGLGVPARCEDGFHFFPASGSAADVQRALHRTCVARGVTFRFDCCAERILHSKGVVAGAQSRDGAFFARRIILATGGCSYPKLGSDGSGFRLAAEAGHTIRPPVPALVPLVSGDPWVRDCAGVTLDNAEVWIDAPRREKLCIAGALLFTHEGISGPAALDLSGTAAEMLSRGKETIVRIRCRRDRSAEDWSRILDVCRRERGARRVRNLLDEHLPARFATALCTICDIGDSKAATLTATHRERLLACLDALPLRIVRTEGFEKAMITRGGVSLREVQPETLESRLIKGLFFAGEVLDLDGPCGGFNLQWAFSSGRLAGRSHGIAK